MGGGRSVCGIDWKNRISGGCVAARRETDTFRRRWKHRGPKPAKTLQRKAVRSTRELESESQNGNTGLNEGRIPERNPLDIRANWRVRALLPASTGLAKTARSLRRYTP